MIDPATGWFEIHEISDMKSITVANVVEQEWLSRYPRPSQVIYDRGSEFIGHEFQRMIKEDYGIVRKPISSKNPQANAIIERIHQVVGNILCTFELQTNFWMKMSLGKEFSVLLLLQSGPLTTQLYKKLQDN